MAQGNIFLERSLMMYLQRTSIFLIIIFGLLNCSHFKTSNTPDYSEREILAKVQIHANAVVEAYKIGNFQKSREELELARRMLDQLHLKSDAEKIDYLDRHFPPADWGLTYAVIEEELAWREKKQGGAGSSQKGEERAEITALGDRSSGIEQYGGTRELMEPPGEESLQQSQDSQAAEDSPDSDNSVLYRNTDFKADSPVLKSGFLGSSYFDSDLHNFIQKEIREIAIHMGEPENFVLPDDFVKEIEHYIRRFQNEDHYREFFQNTLRRSRKYIPALKKYFTEKGFPEEIIYLAFIESGFNPAAKSRSNAVGMFQFIKTTGLDYGLKIDRYRDERYSPIKSAIACREFLHDLVLELGSFTLALSSYNSGPGKTRQALRKLDDFKDRSFWAVREKTDVLKRETREYVPQIFAAIVMAQPGHPPRFGFEDVPYPDKSRYKTVIVPKQISLKKLANTAGIPLHDILELNPDLSSSATATPYRVLNYPLFVPPHIERATIAFVNSQSTPAPKVTYTSSGTSQNSGESRSSGGRESSNSRGTKSYIEYEVQSGNSFSQISDWFGTSVSELESWNSHINHRGGLQIGDIVYIKKTDYYWSKEYHEIQRGEALSTIANRYGVKIEDLKAWNGIRGDTIVAGKTLVIFIRQGKAEIKTTAAKTSAPPPPPGRDGYAGRDGRASTDGVLVKQSISTGESFTYRVAAGNTLSDIAGLFGVSVSEIMNWNSLPDSEIKAGQRLKIVSAKSMKFYKYRVRGGDSISDIASQLGSSIQIIQIVNGKSNSTVNAGEVLSIFSI